MAKTDKEWDENAPTLSVDVRFNAAQMKQLLAGDWVRLEQVTAAATEALIERVEPNWAMEQVRSAAARAGSRVRRRWSTRARACCSWNATTAPAARR